MIFLILLLSTATVIAGGVIELKLAHTNPTTHPYHRACEYLSEIVRERTNGEIVIKIFPASQMGDNRVINESLSMGTLDMVFTGSAHVGKYNPRLTIFQTPYIAKNVDHMLEVVKSPLIVEEIEKTAKEHNIRVLDFPYAGIRHITTRNTPIEKPEDMKGLKIRTPELPMTIEFIRKLGASPTPMPFSELYLALRQGVIDGQENPISTIYWEKLYEAQQYLNLTGHIILMQAMAINEDIYQKLSTTQQNILTEASREAGRYLKEIMDEEEEDLLRRMEAEGVTIIKSDTEAFRAAVREDIIKKFEEDWGIGFAEKLFGM